MIYNFNYHKITFFLHRMYRFYLPKFYYSCVSFIVYISLEMIFFAIACHNLMDFELIFCLPSLLPRPLFLFGEVLPVPPFIAVDVAVTMCSSSLHPSSLDVTDCLRGRARYAFLIGPPQLPCWGGGVTSCVAIPSGASSILSVVCIVRHW